MYAAKCLADPGHAKDCFPEALSTSEALAVACNFARWPATLLCEPLVAVPMFGWINSAGAA